MGNFIYTLTKFITGLVLNQRGFKPSESGIQQPSSSPSSDGGTLVERGKETNTIPKQKVAGGDSNFNISLNDTKLKNSKSLDSMNNRASEFLLCPLLKEKGYNLWGPFCQAWLETGRFQSVIGKHNYWGIKVPKNWDGKIVELKTKEYDIKLGDFVETTAKFIDFEKIEEAHEFYDSLIQRLYVESYLGRKDPLAFFHGLICGQRKWATDPSYEEKLTRVYQMMVLDPRFREFII